MKKKHELEKMAEALSTMLRDFISCNSDYAISSKIRSQDDTLTIVIEASDEEDHDHELYRVHLWHNSLSLFMSEYAWEHYTRETEIIRTVLSSFTFTPCMKV